jgi:hypothetical protein
MKIRLVEAEVFHGQTDMTKLIVVSCNSAKTLGETSPSHVRLSFPRLYNVARRKHRPIYSDFDATRIKPTAQPWLQSHSWYRFTELNDQTR